MNSVIDTVLETYLATYRGLIETERDGQSITLSLPFHLAANHRIEISVTDLGKGICIISDSARTIGEVQAAGFSVTSQMKDRLEGIASLSGLRIVDSHLILESTYEEIGPSIQKFLEVSKMIGDVYLVHKHRDKADSEIILQVQALLQSEGLLYRLKERVQGQLETHPFDIVVPPNGHPGVAVGILGGLNTHTIAQVWGFKCDDIRKAQWNGKVALVYDIRNHWSDASKAILESRADVAVPSNSLSDLAVSVRPS